MNQAEFKMLFRSPLPQNDMDRVRDLGVNAVVAEDEAKALTQIGDAHACFGRISPALLAAARELKWIQAPSAGLDGFFFDELRRSDVIITNLRGIYSDYIADHAFAFLLAIARGLPHYHRKQMERVWGEHTVPVIHLGGAVLGIVGLGGIGLELAKRGHAFGMRIHAVDPAPKARPEYVEKIVPPSGLPELLPDLDVLMIAAPHTNETEYMIGAPQLAAMKPSAVLINVGRGQIVDLGALTKALENGKLAAAGLDVFEKEPLPSDHPLWGMEQVLITPHAAYVSPVVSRRRNDLIVENVRRFVAGEALINVVDTKAGYVVGEG